MAFRPLTDANCGAPNPLVQLTSHLTRDHAHQEQHGQAFPGSSDQLVEQFLQETRAVPQTFHMNGKHLIFTLNQFYNKICYF